VLTADWPLVPSLLALLAAAAVILAAGFRVTHVVDELADRTGMGEAVAGGALLGGTTSLSGLVTLTVGALEGDAGFALSNPLGGIALQTVWLAIADLFYRRANLEHAAASLENVLQSVILTGLLAVPVIGYATPDLQVWSVHPASLAIPVLYLLGLRLVSTMRKDPLWHPEDTPETRTDTPDPASDRSTRSLWVSFALLSATLALAGYVTGRAGLGVVTATGLSGNLVGSTLTTAASSLSELVTLFAAIRIGALTLGIGDIIGGNLFDLLQLTVADAAYRPGPIYTAAGGRRGSGWPADAC
jgi:cation:H+ antiporter